MTTSSRVPQHIPEVIRERLQEQGAGASRRDFLKTSGLFVVSFSATAIPGVLSMLRSTASV